MCKQPASLPEVTIIDGCALLWVISWPSRGVVQDYIDNFIHYIKQKLAKGDVYPVFDRYNEYSIKDAARCCREETGSKKYKLRPDRTLPKKTTILTVTTNKVQLTDVICQQLCVKIENLPSSEEGTMHAQICPNRERSIPNGNQLGVSFCS